MNVMHEIWIKMNANPNFESIVNQFWMRILILKQCLSKITNLNQQWLQILIESSILNQFCMQISILRQFLSKS